MYRFLFDIALDFHSLFEKICNNLLGLPQQLISDNEELNVFKTNDETCDLMGSVVNRHSI